MTRGFRLTQQVCCAALLSAVVGCSGVTGTPQSVSDATTSEAETTAETTTATTTKEADASGLWSDALVVVTTNSVGAAKLGMTEEEVEEAAGVEVTMECTQCDANPTAELEPKENFARFEARNNCSGFDVTFNPGQTQTVATEAGFELGGTVAELQELYGDELEPFTNEGLTYVNGFAITGDDSRLIFGISGEDPSMIEAFYVWPLTYDGC
jgi:hypothetical protein